MVFAVMFWLERAAHRDTIREHLHDLREVAELKQPLRRAETPPKGVLSDDT